jgi:type II secretory pathway component PulM
MIRLIERKKNPPCFPSRVACVCPYRARLGFARLEASAAYLGREARMRAIGIAVFAIVFLAIVYAAFDLRRDHNQINRIREECQRTNSEAGKVKECITELALRHAREPQLP